jgi:hypothetical protein
VGCMRYIGQRLLYVRCLGSVPHGRAGGGRSKRCHAIASVRRILLALTVTCNAV